MIFVYLGRLGLFFALVALALGAFWPHITNLINPYEANDIHSNSKLLPINDHPKFRGGKLKRITSKSERYNTLGGYHMVPNDPALSLNDVLSKMGHEPQNSNNSQTSFSASILYLIIFGIAIMMIYSVISILNARVSNMTSQKSDQTQTEPRKSIFQVNQKRKSREERARQLIQKHGGKNLAQAIRLIATEFARQKELLLLNPDEIIHTRDDDASPVISDNDATEDQKGGSCSGPFNQD